MFKKVLLWPYYLFKYILKRHEKALRNMFEPVVFHRSASVCFIEFIIGAFQCSSITIGLGIGGAYGVCAGVILGTLICPIIGTFLGGALGVSLGGLVGAGIAAYVSKQISRFAKFCAVKLGVVYGPEDEIVSATNPEKYSRSASQFRGYSQRRAFIEMCKEMRAEKNRASSILNRTQKGYISQLIDEVLLHPKRYTTHCYRDINNVRFTFFPRLLPVISDDAPVYFTFQLR